jgi:hypothetical protein
MATRRHSSLSSAITPKDDNGKPAAYGVSTGQFEDGV